MERRGGMKSFRKTSPLRLAQRRKCYSDYNPDRRSCRCLENSMSSYHTDPYYCVLGFKEINGIPQEPCPKPLTTADEIACKEYYSQGKLKSDFSSVPSEVQEEGEKEW